MSYLLIEKRNGGLMSCFNLITASLAHLYDNNITNFYVIWNADTYQNNVNENLFDKFFYQQNKPNGAFPGTKVISVFELSHQYFTPITPTEKFIKLNKVLSHFNYFKNPILNHLHGIVPSRPKSLGVHVRRTDHAIHGDILPDEYYFDKIDKNLETGKYENIFLATDEYKIVDSFKQKYGDKLFINENITRSSNDVTIPFCNYADKDKLAIDIFKEGIALSKCDKMIFTSSNVSSYVRIIKPDIDCEQIDTHIQFR